MTSNSDAEAFVQLVTRSASKIVTPMRATVTAVYELEFSSDIADLIDPHWLQFPPQPYVFHLILAVAMVVLGFIAICGNSAVIYIFSTTKGLRNPSNALIVNLAISDLMMMAVMCPMYTVTSLAGKWVFGRYACQFYGFIGALSGNSSLITMAVISVDRYLVICKPFLVMKSAMTRARAKFAIAFIWIYSFIWAVLPLCGISRYVLEGFLTTCSFDYMDLSFENRLFILLFAIGAYFAPLVVIIVCYLLIIWEVRQHTKKFAKSTKKMNVGELKGNEKERKEIKTAKIAATVVACWVFAWTPYCAVSLLGIAGSPYSDWLTPVASQLPAVFAKTASVYNPIVYAISHPKYREALRKKFPFLICIQLNEEESERSGAGSNSVKGRRNVVESQQSEDDGTSEIVEMDAPPPIKSATSTKKVTEAPATIYRLAQPQPVDSPHQSGRSRLDVTQVSFREGKVELTTSVV